MKTTRVTLSKESDDFIRKLAFENRTNVTYEVNKLIEDAATVASRSADSAIEGPSL